jgi:hypothetical protein
VDFKKNWRQQIFFQSSKNKNSILKMKHLHLAFEETPYLVNVDNFFCSNLSKFQEQKSNFYFSGSEEAFGEVGANDHIFFIAHIQ